MFSRKDTPPDGVDPEGNELEFVRDPDSGAVVQQGGAKVTGSYVDDQGDTVFTVSLKSDQVMRRRW